MIPYLLILLTTSPLSLSSTTYHQSSRRSNSRDISRRRPVKSPKTYFSHAMEFVKEPPDNPALEQRVRKAFVPEDMTSQPFSNIDDRKAKFFTANSNGLPAGMQVGELTLGQNRLMYTYVNATGLSAAAGIMVVGFLAVGGALYGLNYLNGENENGSGFNFNGFNSSKSDKLPSTEVTQWGNWDGFDVARNKR